MKKNWEKLALKFDALVLRERIIVSLACVFGLLAIAYTIWIEPDLKKKKLLLDQATTEQSKLLAVKTEIQQKNAVKAADPDVVEKARLEKVKNDIAKLHETLRERQKGLVSSDRMAKLIEDIVRQNDRLHLTAMKTLPVTILNESKKAPEVSGQMPEKEKEFVENALGRKLEGVGTNSAQAKIESPIEEVYKYGVELTLEGNYLDLLDYMVAVKAMPWQLFWGGAVLKVDAYPKSTLTLTLFTLSLDKKWLYL